MYEKATCLLDSGIGKATTRTLACVDFGPGEVEEPSSCKEKTDPVLAPGSKRSGDGPDLVQLQLHED